MALNALTQSDGKSNKFEMKIINVGGQEFKIHPEIKLFVGGEAVQAKDVQAKLKNFSAKDIETLKTQLKSIQGYSGLYGGERKAVDPVDFERCNRVEAKRLGIKYTFYGEDTVTGRYSCADGKFDMVW